MAKQDAVQRACEMFNAPGNQVPQLAREYANALCRKYGGCSEVIITAFAHYAQIEEKLPCRDSLYSANSEDRQFLRRLSLFLQNFLQSKEMR